MAPSHQNDKNEDGADKLPETDWGKVFSKLLCHTSLTYEDILNRTKPQLDAILSDLPENLSLKIGIPGIFGGALDKTEPAKKTNKPPKLSEFMAFANAYNGI